MSAPALAIPENTPGTGSMAQTAIAAALARGSQTAELQPPAEPVGTPAPAADPAVTANPAAPPVEAAAPVVEEDNFELDLSSNPLEAPAIDPSAPVVQDVSRAQFDKTYEEFNKHPRGRQIVEAHKLVAQLSASPEEGGLGLPLSREQVVAWHRDHSLIDQMRSDFESATPQAAKNFVNYWLGRDDQNRALPGSEAMISHLPEAIKTEAPEAYAHLSGHMARNFLSRLNTEAADPSYTAEDRTRIKSAAAIFAHLLGVQAPASEPKAQDSSEVERLRRENEMLRNGRVQQSSESTRVKITGDLERVVRTDAANRLASRKDNLDPAIYKAIENQLVLDMKNLIQSNPTVYREIEKNVGRMSAKGIDPNLLKQTVFIMRQTYAGNVGPMGAKYLTAAGQQIVQRSDDQRGVLQQAQNKVAPSPSAAPGNSVSFGGLNPGESLRDGLRRKLETARQA
jgi:hypothetical protein